VKFSLSVYLKYLDVNDIGLWLSAWYQIGDDNIILTSVCSIVEKKNISTLSPVLSFV
jgi:hypothetical protein